MFVVFLVVGVWFLVLVILFFVFCGWFGILFLVFVVVGGLVFLGRFFLCGCVLFDICKLFDNFLYLYRGW